MADFEFTGLKLPTPYQMRRYIEEGRQFTGNQRKAAAKAGQAQKDGSYPIKNRQDLKNAIQAFGRSKNKAATKAHIIRRAKALGLTSLLPKEWKVKTDKASYELVTCPEEGCERAFLHEDGLLDHAESVHTFNDIERILSEHIREKHSKPSTREEAGTYSWISDIAEDWVVFTVEKPKDISLFKASYTIVNEVVTLGEPVEVRRRTVYDPVKKEK